MEQRDLNSEEAQLDQIRAIAKSRIKALVKARKNEAKDNHIEKSRISTEIKLAKKELHEIEAKLASLAEAPSSAESNIAPDYVDPFTISENTNGWDEFVTNSHASHYHRLAWENIFTEVMGRETRYLAARDASNEILGILPVAITRSRLFGCYGVSLPYVNYGGPCAIADNIENALIKHAFSEVESWQLSHLEIRDTKNRADLHARTDKFCMTLDLSAHQSSAQLLDYLGTKVRSQIKKSQSSGIKFEVGGLNLLPDFYTVFTRNMRDLGTPVYSKDLFASILETFPADTTLVVGFYLDEPVSCAFLLNNNGEWEIPWASTIRSANKIAANMALYARVLEEVIGRGADSFDFGRSSRDAPTYKFKKQWRAEPKQLYWYYSTPEYANALTTTSPRYQLAIKAWQKLPLFVANAIGPSIVKNLP